MDKQELIRLIEAYTPYDMQNEAHKDQMLAYLKQTEQFLGKVNPAGHITASSWIVSKEGTHVLLTHHAKLGRWLQLGGHTEIDEDIWESALREAREESGFKRFRLLDRAIFDLDVHEIPGRGDVGAHYHYDLRFLLRAEGEEAIMVSEESNDVRWVLLDDVEKMTQEWSVIRMVEKTRKHR